MMGYKVVRYQTHGSIAMSDQDMQKGSVDFNCLLSHWLPDLTAMVGWL